MPLIYFLYAIVIMFATISGAVAGLGGGVIIKQAFDVIGYHDAVSIGFYASVAIFTMSVVALIKQIRFGFKYDVKIVIFMSLGSFIGGYLGEQLFMLTLSFMNERYVVAMQAILLAVTLILILLYEHFKDRITHYQVRHIGAMFLIGLILGSYSVFIGIGGGPINITVLMLMFSFTMKESIIYGIAIVFFSQISKLGSIILSGEIMNHPLSYIILVSVSAVVGGYVGTIINQRASNKAVEITFRVLVVFLLVLTMINSVRNII